MELLRRRQRLRRFKKTYSYFTYESRDTLKSFTLIITVKTIPKLNLGHCEKFEIDIRRCGSRSLENAEFGHSRCCFAEDGKEMYQEL